MLKRIGKYEITGELGRGGFSRVYRGFDPNVNRPVAIKVATRESDPEHLSRFRNEASAAGNLRHRNIVTIHDYGDEEGVPYLVMELLDGRDLHQVSKSGSKLSLIEKVQIMSQVAEGLNCAHRHGIVHRDIKPANIMLLLDGTVKILDFGIARLAHDISHLTQSGHMVGTPLYMSPEQLAGSQADTLCDIWAYGVNYFELLVGQHPFLASDNVRLTRNITMIDPPPVHALAAGIPDSLAQVIQRALTKDRRRRYQSMEEILVDTNPILRQLQREHTKALFNAGLKFKDDGQLAASQQAFRRVLEVDPSNDDAQHILKSLQKQTHEAKFAPQPPAWHSAPLTKSFEIAAVPIRKAPSDPRTSSTYAGGSRSASAAVATPPSAPPLSAPLAAPVLAPVTPTPFREPVTPVEAVGATAAPAVVESSPKPLSQPVPQTIPQSGKQAAALNGHASPVVTPAAPPPPVLPVVELSPVAAPVAHAAPGTSATDFIAVSLAPSVREAVRRGPITPPLARTSARSPRVPEPSPVIGAKAKNLEPAPAPTPNLFIGGPVQNASPVLEKPAPNTSRVVEKAPPAPIPVVEKPAASNKPAIEKPAPAPKPLTAKVEEAEIVEPTPLPAPLPAPVRQPVQAPLPRDSGVREAAARISSRANSILNLAEANPPAAASAPPIQPAEPQPAVIKRRPVAYPARRDDEPSSIRRLPQGTSRAKKPTPTHVASLTVVKKQKTERVSTSKFPWTIVGFSAAALVAAAGMLMMLWSGNGIQRVVPASLSPASLTFEWKAGGRTPERMPVLLTGGPADASYTAKTDSTWIVVNPAEDRTQRSWLVDVKPEDLSIGTHTGLVEVVSQDGFRYRTFVTLVVAGEGSQPSLPAPRAAENPTPAPLQRPKTAPKSSENSSLTPTPKTTETAEPAIIRRTPSHDGGSETETRIAAPAKVPRPLALVKPPAATDQTAKTSQKPAIKKPAGSAIDID